MFSNGALNFGQLYMDEAPGGCETGCINTFIDEGGCSAGCLVAEVDPDGCSTGCKFNITLNPALLFSHADVGKVNTTPVMKFSFNDPTGSLTLGTLENSLTQLESVTFPSLDLSGSSIAETWTPTVISHSFMNTTPASSATNSITTSPANLGINVDAVSYSAPKSFQWVAGENHTLAATSPQSGAAGVRYAFNSWSDSGAASHTVTGPATPTTYMANFTTEYQLSIQLLPRLTGTTNPASGSWYTAGSNVTVTASSQTHPTWRPVWTGCTVLSGNNCIVDMSGPLDVSATLSAPLVKIGTTNYANTIAGAYDLVATFGTVLAQATDFTEDLVFDRTVIKGESISFTLRGGYDSAFATATGTTTIHGSVTIAKGTVTFDKITIR